MNTEDKTKLDRVIRKSKQFRKELDDDKKNMDEEVVEIKNKTILSLFRASEHSKKKGGKASGALLKKNQKTHQKEAKKIRSEADRFRRYRKEEKYPPSTTTILKIF